MMSMEAKNHLCGREATWTDDDADMAAMEEALRQNVAKGYMEVTGWDENGITLYRLTEAGHAHMNELFKELKP